VVKIAIIVPLNVLKKTVLFFSWLRARLESYAKNEREKPATQTV